MELFGIEFEEKTLRTLFALAFIVIAIEVCLVDGIYFLRMFINFLLSKFWKRKIHIMDKCSLSGICLTRDLDVVLNHMNNARFLREVDMARIDFYIRTKLYSTIRSKGGHIWLAASNIRYRRFIRLFQRFRIVTKVVYWDAEHIYIEHSFVGNGKDQFVHAVMYCQYKVIDCSAEDVMQTLMKEGSEILKKPEAPEQIVKFIELQDSSRRTAKNSNNNNQIV